MSDFDKYVAQWMSRAGDNLPKEAREQLLKNMHNSLDDYEALRDPAAARARKEAVEKSKQREEEKKKKEEARKLQEEQDRKRQERQANLPPLPPSRSATETTVGSPGPAAPDATAKPKKKKTGVKKSSTASSAAAASASSRAARSTESSSQDNSHGTTGNPHSTDKEVAASATRKSRTSQKIPYSKETTAKPAKSRQSGTVPVKDIDFKFGERVDEELRKLEAEKAEKAAKAATANKKKVKISPVVQTSEPLPSADVEAPAPAAASGAAAEFTVPAATPPSSTPPPSALAETAAAGEAAPVQADPLAATAAPPPPKNGRKRSSPPPLDQVVAEGAEREGVEGGCGGPLADGDVDGLKPSHSSDEAEVNQKERSSSSSSGGSSFVPSLGATKNYQEQLNAFHFASVGNERDGSGGDDDGDRSDLIDDAEEEFIDDREDVRRRTMQMQRPSRPAISDSTLDIDEARIANFPTTPKSQNKVKTISRVLVRHFLFSTLDDSDIAKFASIMDLEKFEAGDKLLAAGEPNDTFYIILDGEAEVREVNDAGASVVVPLVRGSTCGDVALMYEVRNEADVVARTPVQVASLERRTYKMITSRAMEEKRKKYIDFLAGISLFSGLTPYELERVAESLKEDSYVEGQKIIAYGVPNHWLHIVLEGTLRVASPSTDAAADGAAGEEEKEVALVHRGEFVGEIEFIFHHLPVASVYAASPVVKTAKLSRRSFDVLPSEVREKLVRLVEEDETYASYHRRMRSASPPAFDMTPPFDAPPASVQKSMRQYESEQSEGTSAANGTPPPPAAIGRSPSA